MVEVWRPTEAHDRYGDDPTYLEQRFGVRPLGEFLSETGVVGVTRYVVMPSFAGESIHTFVFRSAEVVIESRCSEKSLWYSLDGGDWKPPVEKKIARPLDSLPAPISNWKSLKDAVVAAPTVKTAILDGREYCTLDGIGYRHTLVDAETDLYAEWSSPGEEASNHVGQLILVRAYSELLQSSDSIDS